MKDSCSTRNILLGLPLLCKWVRKYVFLLRGAGVVDVVLVVVVVATGKFQWYTLAGLPLAVKSIDTFTIEQIKSIELNWFIQFNCITFLKSSDGARWFNVA